MDPIRKLTRQLSRYELDYQLHWLPCDSSPRPDNLQYRFWKSLGNGGREVICKLFNLCLYNHCIPASWEENNNTILIYKKGDPSNPANWWPITLQNSIYQFYASQQDTTRSQNGQTTRDSTTGSGPCHHCRDRARRAKVLQAEYRQNPKCFRSIIKEEPVYCQILKDQLEAHFSCSPPPSSPPPPA